jgi:RNA polymerase sigma factor (sigma-70 family)
MKIVEEQIPELILAQKDTLVLSHLYKELFPTVQNYIKRNNGIADDAHDVFQDAIIYFYKQVVEKTFDTKYKVYGYIYKLAINKWLNKLSKDKKMVFHSEMIDNMDGKYSEETSMKETSPSDFLVKYVSILGEKCVELLTYKIYSDMLFEDIVLRMKYVSEAAAKMNFKRCREKLVEIIKKNPALADQLRN